MPELHYPTAAMTAPAIALTTLLVSFQGAQIPLESEHKNKNKKKAQKCPSCFLSPISQDLDMQKVPKKIRTKWRIWPAIAAVFQMPLLNQRNFYIFRLFWLPPVSLCGRGWGRSHLERERRKHNKPLVSNLRPFGYYCTAFRIPADTTGCYSVREKYS